MVTICIRTNDKPKPESPSVQLPEMHIHITSTACIAGGFNTEGLQPGKVVSVAGVGCFGR